MPSAPRTPKTLQDGDDESNAGAERAKVDGDAMGAASAAHPTQAMPSVQRTPKRLQDSDEESMPASSVPKTEKRKPANVSTKRDNQS
eukprot:8916776-Alexandrium_andersonii.AAC.1